MQAATGGMRSTVTQLREVRENMSEGLRFYMSLQEAISTLSQQAGDYTLTRRLQRCSLLSFNPVGIIFTF